MAFMQVCVFFYRRVDFVESCISAITRSVGELKVDLNINIDGPKSDKDRAAVAAVREAVAKLELSAFRNVRVVSSDINRGLAESVITGVTRAFQFGDEVVVVEDDLLVAPNFLNFMATALEQYAQNFSIGSVSGFSFPAKKDADFDAFFHIRPTSWGWATWRNRWALVEWEVNEEYLKKIDYSPQTMKTLGDDMPRMLRAYVDGRIDSWAIRWALAHHHTNWLVVTPYLSLIRNIGFGEVSATNTLTNNPFYLMEDESAAGTPLRLPFSIGVSKLNVLLTNTFNSNFMRLVQKYAPTYLWRLMYWSAYYVVSKASLRGYT